MRQPHIILITTDQQRGDCLGLDGHPVLSTPNLDALGADGGFFQQAYSEVPSCIPARRILLTGLNQAATGMVGYQDCVDWNPPLTLAGELANAGYQTHLVGKLHLWPHRKRYGFQSMDWSDGPYTQLGGADWASKDDYNAFLRRNVDEPDAGIAHGIDVNGWVGRPWHLDERLSFENWCVTQSIEFLRRRDPSQPFFLNLSMFAPHPPLTPPAMYYDRYMQMDLPQPVIGDWVREERSCATGAGGAPTASSHVKMDAATLKRCRAAYYGLVNHVDDQVGRLVQALRRMNLWQDTFILFTSDHGEMLGDHHLFRKTFAYEASARVPFLVHAPKWMECRSGVRVRNAVGLQDVCPTLLDAAGAKIPSAVCGRSVLPFMRGQTPQWREFLHGEHASCYAKEDAMHYLTDGEEKYIWFSQTGEEQLFNLREDRNETRNLIANPVNSARADVWRRRMITQLKDRPEGFSDGKRLVAGKAHGNLIPA